MNKKIYKLINDFAFFVVLANNIILPLLHAGYDIWHFLYFIISFVAITILITYYDKKIEEKENEINYLKKHK